MHGRSLRYRLFGWCGAVLDGHTNLDLCIARDLLALELDRRFGTAANNLHGATARSYCPLVGITLSAPGHAGAQGSFRALVEIPRTADSNRKWNILDGNLDFGSIGPSIIRCSYNVRVNGIAGD